MPIGIHFGGTGLIYKHFCHIAIMSQASLIKNYLELASLDPENPLLGYGFVNQRTLVPNGKKALVRAFSPKGSLEAAFRAYSGALAREVIVCSVNFRTFYTEHTV